MSNLKQRILFSVAAVPITLLVTYLGGWYLWGFILAVLEIAWWEYCNILKFRGFYSKIALTGYLGMALFLARAWQPTSSWIATDALIFLFLLIGFVGELWLKDIAFSVSRMSVQFMGLIYLGLTGYSIYLVSTLHNQAWKIFVPFLASIWVCDTFAYFVGTRWGKHPLHPTVSPAKSVEGTLAGFVGAILGFSVCLFWMDLRLLPHVFILGVLIALFGQTGDLIESLIKRWAGIKDSSKLLPGHGGVLDRIDSLLFAAPVVVFYFRHIL